MATLTWRPLPSHFFQLRDRMEQEIARSIASLGERSALRDAIEYALTNGGKRFRPLIVLLVAEGLGHDLPVYEAALAVEYFHTASLIADDLPCMDDAEERRGKPTLHKVYGETTALLASYALITAAFEKIHKNAQSLHLERAPFCGFADRIACIALETASVCSGIRGATGGQFLDLFPEAMTLSAIKRVIYKKTVTLFEVSFVFGWLFGGGEIPRLPLVKRAAYHLGMAFQIADDLGDLAEDEKMQREMNFAHFIGKERSRLLFEEEMRLFRQALCDLGLDTPSFSKMSELLDFRLRQAQ